MPKVTWAQTNFNGGEFSPLMYGRSDLKKYATGLATCLNYVPTIQGGLTRRPGTRYIAQTKDNSTVRLVAFEFSETQTYIIEFGHLYVRFYTNDGQLLESTDTFRLLTEDGFYLKAENGRYLVNEATGAYELSSSYTAADLPNLAFAQSADVLYIVHPRHPPRKLQRLGEMDWQFEDIVFLDGPYLNVNTATTKFTSNITGPWEEGDDYAIVHASRRINVNNRQGFLSSDVGRVIRLKTDSTWGWGIIMGCIDKDNISVKWMTSVGTTATVNWRLGVWGDTNGYPGAITFNQDRLTFAGCPEYPSRVDASNSSDYENFAPTERDGTVIDSNALSFTLNSTKSNVINWMLSDEWGLLAGTASGEWVVAASTTAVAITPTNISAKMVSSYGSADVLPAKMGKSTLFVQRTRRKLREMTYQFTLGTFQSPDISLIAEHLTASGIKEMAVALAPQSILWMVRNDGVLVGMSYDKDQDVLGWHQHRLGGYSDAAQTLPPLVESVAVIPSPATDRDEVWIAVKRHINGQDVRTVELLSKYWEDGDSVSDAVFVDCSAAYDGRATNTRTTTVSGLTWLANQTVSVLADGAVHPDCVVDTYGAITLQRSALVVQVGLGYSSQGKTLRIEAGGNDGPAQGKLKRIHRVIFRVFQSVGFNVQATGRDAFPEPWRSSADRMDQQTALFTGDQRWAWDGSYEVEGQIAWSQAEPVPSNILAVAAQMETQDGG